MELGSGAHIGTAMNRSNSLLQLSSISYVLMSCSFVPGHEFSVVQKEVSDLIEGHILVGHAIHNDLRTLYLSHPRSHIRDTSKYAFNDIHIGFFN